MRIAVLGGNGSIGHAIVRRAPHRGHTVRAVVRDPRNTREMPPGTEVVGTDLLDGDEVLRACEGCDAIVHAGNAPYPEWAAKVPAMARNALRAAEATGAVLGFPGNVYVYGHPRTRPATEDHPMEPHTVKGKIRLHIEREYLQAHREGRIKVVIPRYPDFYGVGIVHEFVRPIYEGALTGKGCRWPITLDAPHEFIFIDDAADAMLTLLETPAALGRAVHVPGPGMTTARDFISIAYRLGGHEPKIGVYGRGMVRLVGLWNPMARAAYEMMYLFDEPVILDGTLYRTLTGSPHPATSYEEGMRKTLEWYRTVRTTSSQTELRGAPGPRIGKSI
ncbi:MAG TPA: NAD-dependent epimerase/dehydratase family protein [Thermoplasmata archaeon]|nr:NAD-dependent epimerase/dehydratase family protein [Thermoplasmata archaeon]